MSINRFLAAMGGCWLTIISCFLPTDLSRRPHQKGDFELPVMLGSWRLREQGQLPDEDLAMFRATHHWRRTFQSIETQQALVATLISGPAGPLTSHQPESCYARIGYHPLGAWTRRRVAGNQADEFRYQTFESPSDDRPAISVALAWHDGQHWAAPNHPRWQFAGCSTLSRLQVSLAHPRGTSLAARQSLQQFIELAVAQEKMTPASLSGLAAPVLPNISPTHGNPE